MTDQPNDLAAIIAVTEQYTQVQGPNEEHPSLTYVPQDERRAFLDAALAGVELGTYDRRILDWIVQWDDYTARLITSLIVRARRVSYTEGTRARSAAAVPGGWDLVMQQALRDAIRFCEHEAGAWPAEQIGLYRSLAGELGIEVDL